MAKSPGRQSYKQENKRDGSMILKSLRKIGYGDVNWAEMTCGSTVLGVAL